MFDEQYYPSGHGHESIGIVWSIEIILVKQFHALGIVPQRQKSFQADFSSIELHALWTLAFQDSQASGDGL